MLPLVGCAEKLPALEGVRGRSCIRVLRVQAPEKIEVALLRGTSADEDGNVSFEREAIRELR